MSDNTQGADCTGKDCHRDEHAVGGPDEVDKERALFRAHDSRQRAGMAELHAELAGLRADTLKLEDLLTRLWQWQSEVNAAGVVSPLVPKDLAREVVAALTGEDGVGEDLPAGAAEQLDATLAAVHDAGAAAKGFAAGMERAAAIAEPMHGEFGHRIAQAIRKAAAAAVPVSGDPPPHGDAGGTRGTQEDT